MPSPEWVIERGIGETRFARIDQGRIVEARILVEGIVPAGSELLGKLKRSGLQLFADVDGQEYLLSDGAHGVTDGAPLRIEVVREYIPGAEGWKRPLGRLIHGAVRLADKIAGREIAFPAEMSLLDVAGWPDLLEEARSGIVHFDGGELRIFPTPAMTLIDVDGILPPAQLGRNAAFAAARTILRHGIGGSIGIDFPTVSGKSARTEIDSAIDEIMPRPFERTSLNGFGFLQIVRPRRHASLFELAWDRSAFEARALMRQAAREVGAIRLAAHPAVIAALEANPGWVEKLSHQVGGTVSLRGDASLAISAGYAERA